jgi:hypothetical protein
MLWWRTRTSPGGSEPGGPQYDHSVLIEAAARLRDAGKWQAAADAYLIADARYRTPPAQNRTCGIPAYGSHLGCLTAKRIDGQG